MKLHGLILDYGGVLTDHGDLSATGEADDVDISAKPPLLAVVRDLHVRGIRVAVLSNADGWDERPEWTAVFDAVLLSGELGAAKPEPAAYELAAGRLGLEPAQCVFVDDQHDNVSGAVAVGMVGVQHRSVESTTDELAALFPPA